MSILVMALWLVSSACAHLLASSGLVLLGLLAWSWLEYALHRFVLHGLPPFAAWHQLHHQRPRALICAPTLFSGGLIGLLVFAPALLLSGLWQACALTLGVLLGYLAYSWIHHLAHHGHVDARWLRRRQHWHALHHRRAAAEQRACYGVSTAFWDHVFGTLPRRP
ncbi:MAG: sterol desaturase family protein [Burkholderiaceae bacterium]